jgi:hypothetical protein
MQQRKLELLADYFQFYLQDEPASSELSDAWTEDAVGRYLAVAPGIVGVGTSTNGNVAVTIEVLEHEPAKSHEGYDQNNDCSLELAKGPLVVAGCTDYFAEAARIPMAAGPYRVRVNYRLAGEESYLVQLWPAPPIDPVVVRARAA